MPCLKIVPEPYETYEDTYTLIHRYIYPKSVCIGGLAVDPFNAADHMEFYRLFWILSTVRKIFKNHSNRIMRKLFWKKKRIPMGV